MLVLSQCDAADIEDYGRSHLQEYQDNLLSFEDAAQITTESIFKTFRTVEDNPFFALVRIFRFGPRGDVNEALLSQSDTDATYWLTLMGSYGLEDAWCHRTGSIGHQLIPADSPATPMLRAAFDQIGLTFGRPQSLNTITLQGSSGSTLSQYFHVEQALGSPYIPAQDEFVDPYSIQSVLGIGCPFRDQSAYVCIAFSTEAINAEQADMFNSLNPFVGTLLATYNESRLWHA